ncbi:MAG: deoxyribose-phosphate aldolase [Eubacteriales bacterium]|nr:deoxyribose-phosphate aldolase [Eubacteriales bacterium]
MNPLNTYLDHTLLKADATRADILAVVAEAKAYHTASVCVNSCYAALVASELVGSGVKTCVVVGFPLGAMSSGAKAVEAALAVREGAQEIDMVMSIGAAKAGDWASVQADIAAVVNASKPAIVKVIIETCLLTNEEKVKACLAAKAAGAAFVKTSTGFSTGGATTEDIALMRKTVGSEMGVKASGGVRSREQALAMIEAGASRIGCSSTKKIME